MVCCYTSDNPSKERGDGGCGGGGGGKGGGKEEVGRIKKMKVN